MGNDYVKIGNVLRALLPQMVIKIKPKSLDYGCWLIACPVDQAENACDEWNINLGEIPESSDDEIIIAVYSIILTTFYDMEELLCSELDKDDDVKRLNAFLRDLACNLNDVTDLEYGDICLHINNSLSYGGAYRLHVDYKAVRITKLEYTPTDNEFMSSYWMLIYPARRSCISRLAIVGRLERLLGTEEFNYHVPSAQAEVLYVTIIPRNLIVRINLSGFIGAPERVSLELVGILSNSVWGIMSREHIDSVVSKLPLERVSYIQARKLFLKGRDDGKDNEFVEKLYPASMWTP